MFGVPLAEGWPLLCSIVTDWLQLQSSALLGLAQARPLFTSFLVFVTMTNDTIVNKRGGKWQSRLCKTSLEGSSLTSDK